MKNNESFEESPAPDEKSVREELEQVRRMILDTQANIVQVKADAMKDPSQAGALVHLKTILEIGRAHV